MRTKILFKRKILFFMLCGLIHQANAQNEIKGKVVDEYNNPIVGATVKGLKTTMSTTTDIDGTFTLETPGEVKKLKITSPGKFDVTTSVQKSHMVKMTQRKMWGMKQEKSTGFLNLEMAIPQYNEFPVGLMGGWIHKSGFGFYAKGLYAKEKSHNGALWLGDDNRFYKNAYSSYRDLDNVPVTGKYKSSFISGGGGVVIRIGAPLMLYAGASYVNRRVTLECQDGTWANWELSGWQRKDRHFGGDGALIEAGIMGNIKHININLGGGGCTSGLGYNIHFGIGYIF